MAGRRRADRSSIGARTEWRAACARAYCFACIAGGSALLGWTEVHWHPHDHLRFFAYLLSAVVASLLKVRLPGITGTASVSFLFVLTGIVDLSLPEAMAIAALSMLAQCVWHTEKPPQLMQVAFSVCSLTISTYAAGVAYAGALTAVAEPFALAVLALAFYFSNALTVAGIIALTEGKRLATIMMRSKWLLPYYAGGTSMAWMIGMMPHSIQWEVPIICLPVVYIVHRSYSTYMAQMEQEKKHVEEVNSLHLRTIEALALAIDAKDHATHDHLQRVQLYALEIGRELGLDDAEMEALRAASVLHDIGKLAVPEHIITKPGKLTPAEFEKMKIHPVVGAEILERVAFPYPVVPIVRAHHEKWNGNGYPYGLKGEEIPIGARILAAVDCFDALASDRQYRKALPLDEAMARVVSESGTSFDPAVVEVLERRYRELETRAQSMSHAAPAALSTDIRITRGDAPAAGFQAGGACDSASLESLGDALAESKSSERCSLPPSLSVLGRDAALDVLAARVKSALNYDAMALFLPSAAGLTPEYVGGGEHGSALRPLRVLEGEGLAGWVAKERRPIVNGNPMVEPGYEAAGGRLRAALAIPVEMANDQLAVLTLYRLEADSFTARDARTLFSLCAALAEVLNRPADALCIPENALAQVPAFTM